MSVASPRSPAEASLLAHIDQTRDKHLVTPYFQRAEALFPDQWARHIAPAIRAMDFANVLELACGHGRNTNRLLDLVAAADGVISLVDVNEHCLEACRERFRDDPRARRADGSLRVRYILNDGRSLEQIESNSVSLVYSWDSVVHFHRDLVRAYLHEFARVLAPGGEGGRGFIHHSNYGAVCPNSKSNWTDNPHWRSTVSAESFAADCTAAGLVVELQSLIDWRECPTLDCITIFRKP